MLRDVKKSQNFFFFIFILCLSFLLGIPSTLHANDSQEEKTAPHYVDFLNVFSKTDPYHLYDRMMDFPCLTQGIPIYRFRTPGAYRYDKHDMGQEPISAAHLGILLMSQRDVALVTCPQNHTSECKNIDNILHHLEEC